MLSDFALERIRTDHIIVVLQVGQQDPERLRFLKKDFEAACHGDERQQNKVCVRLRNKMNTRAGREKFVSIAWPAITALSYNEDRHELPKGGVPSPALIPR